MFGAMRILHCHTTSYNNSIKSLHLLTNITTYLPVAVQSQDLFGVVRMINLL